MSEMQEQIQRIENKLQQLLKEYNAAQKEIQRLQKENKRLSGQLQFFEEQAHEHNQKADVSKLGSQHLKSTSKKALEKRIDAYLKDIDKCLALLNS